MERISHWMAWSAVALIVLFCGLNWSALNAPTSLNLLVADVDAPMGVVLVALTGVFVVLFLVATLYSRIANLMETRKLHKELRHKQEVADSAEASRLEALQHLITSEFRQLNERIGKLERVVNEPLVKLP
ncbi:LapA family protein [Hydrogenophaga sp.]|uniref:LapA family protein n=1 Tax=Hydrogenophaga sp. TaxID=1904254 RepID=UPI003567A423